MAQGLPPPPCFLPTTSAVAAGDGINAAKHTEYFSKRFISSPTNTTVRRCQDSVLNTSSPVHGRSARAREREAGARGAAAARRRRPHHFLMRCSPLADRILMAPSLIHQGNTGPCEAGLAHPPAPPLGLPLSSPHPMDTGAGGGSPFQIGLCCFLQEKAPSLWSPVGLAFLLSP